MRTTRSADFSLYLFFNNLLNKPLGIYLFPDVSKDFKLDMDANFDRIGAVLAQIYDKGRERVIAYGSTF